MLDPDVVLNSILASFQSIPELAAELGAPTIPAEDSITGHFFFSGDENAYARALAEMRSPSIMVAYIDYIMGNFDGSTLWKHRLELCIRARNKASNGSALSAQHMWWMAMNFPISEPQVAPNIRSVDLCGGNLFLNEANLKHQIDELGQDFLIGTMVFNELGDVGPDGVNELCIGPASTIQHAADVDGFLEAIRTHLSDEEQQHLLERIEEEGVSYGSARTK